MLRPLAGALAALALSAGAALADEPPPRRDFAVALEPLELIPHSPHGVSQWMIAVSGERRVLGESSTVLVLGFGPATSDAFSLLVFHVAGQARYPIIGGFDRNVHVAAELGFSGASGTQSSGVAGAGLRQEHVTLAAVTAGAYLGVKYTTGGGLAGYVQVGWAGVLGQSSTQVFDAGALSPFSPRIGIGWSF